MENRILGNRYQLIEKIGGGGMAIVYKAKCNLLNRYTAVKILRPEFTSDEEFIKRFKVEAQASASLSHPNIVSIYDVGNEGDTHYIVMEYVDGITLKNYILKKGELPWKTAVNIAIQICSALEHAHKNHIVHRDIKPHNIIITDELVAKVTDFGIARAVSTSTMTVSGNTIGSVHYFSPEQARGAYTDDKSDLYSLGIVLYEMLTGRVPFDADTPVSVALMHIQENPIPPVEIRQSIPQSLNAIILKALQKNQSQRYSSATEMLKDLYKALRTPEENFVEVEDVSTFDTQKIPIIGEEVLKRADRKNSFREDSDVEQMPKIKNTPKRDKLTFIAASLTAFVIVSVLSFMGFRFMTHLFLGAKTTELPAPELIGKTIEQAREILKDQNIKLTEVEQRFDTTVAKGTILEQKPEPNIKVKVPGEIRVVLSKGNKPVVVPDLKGMELREAQYKLEEYNLKYRELNEFSNIPQGYVSRQIPEANTEVEEL